MSLLAVDAVDVHVSCFIILKAFHVTALLLLLVVMLQYHGDIGWNSSKIIYFVYHFCLYYCLCMCVFSCLRCLICLL